METTIYLIRHSKQFENNGITYTNDTEQIDNEKIILTVEGERKAYELAEKLTSVDTLWTSDYARAKSTAKYIAEKFNIPMNVDCKLGERRLGNKEELMKLGEGQKCSYTILQMINPDIKVTGGESMKDVQKRGTEAIQRIINENKGKQVAIVTHGAFIRYIIAKYAKINEDTYELVYKDKIVAKEKTNSPDVFKLVYDENELVNIEHIDYEKSMIN